MGVTIGVLYVRRSIYIQASPERVWDEFDSFERIAGWLNLGHKLLSIEPRVGAEARFSVETNGEVQQFGGRVLLVEPGRELSFESNWDGPDAWPVPTIWTIRLTPVFEGTLVEILHHGFERLGKDAADALEGYEGGWDIKHLKALRAIIER